MGLRYRLSRARYFLVLAALTSALQHASAAVTPDTYTGLTGGVWSDPNNWSAAAVPDNFGATTYDAIINNASPITVNLDSSPTIDALTLAAPDTLNMLNGKVLTLNGTASGNSGSILLGSSAQLRFNGDFTLSGGGSISMGLTTALSSGSAGSHFFTDNFISGRGSIGLNTLRIINTGTISATTGILSMIPFTAPDGLISTGDLRADGEPFFFSGSSYQISGALEAINGGSLIFSSGNVAITCPTTLSTGSISFNATSQSAARITGIGAASVGGNASLTSDGASITTLQLAANARETIRQNGSAQGASEVSSLMLAGSSNGWTSTLDLTNNVMILLNGDTTSKAAALSTLTNQISSGKNGGAWNGTGITSSTVALDNSGTNAHHTTLALIDNAELGATSFRGQTGLDSNSLLVVQAVLGDVDLSGGVDFGDLLKVAQNFGKPGGWAEGNMEGPDNGGTSTTVDFGDLLLVAQHFGQTLPLVADDSPDLDGEVTGLSVPEPGSLAILGIGLVLLWPKARSPNKDTFWRSQTDLVGDQG